MSVSGRVSSEPYIDKVLATGFLATIKEYQQLNTTCTVSILP